MTRQPGGPRNAQEVDEAILKALVDIRDQLTQIANRMAAAEVRAEEQLRMLRQRRDLPLQQMNPEQARQQRTRAVMLNQGYWYQNTVTWLSDRRRGIDTELVPFVDLSTGLDIEGFPATIGDIDHIDESDVRRILAALEMATDGLDTAEIRDLLRSRVVYGYSYTTQ